MTTMLQAVGQVSEDGEVSDALKESFALKAREKMQEENPTCFGREVGIPNPLASKELADSFYNPSEESIEDMLERSEGFESTWISLLEDTTTSVIDAESQQLLKSAFPASGYPGDPTAVILEIVNTIKDTLSEFVSNVEELISSYFDRIIVRAQQIIGLLITFVQSGFTAVRAFISGLIKQFEIIFEPEGEEFIKKISSAIKDKKDEIVEKIKAMLNIELPELSFNFDLSVEGIAILLGLDIKFPEFQLPSLTLPGPPIPGIVMTFFEIIKGIVEFIIKFPIKIFEIGVKIVEFIFSVDFLGLIQYLQSIILEVFLKVILTIIPDISEYPTLMGILFAYVEIVGSQMAVVTLGHFIGPGLILQQANDLIMDGI